MEIAIIIWLLCAIGGGLIAQSKNRSFAGGFICGLGLGIIGLIILLCQSNKNKTPSSDSIINTEIQGGEIINTEVLYYVFFDNEKYGPFSLSELKINYGEYLTKDTLITTNTINEWYEACCFECFDDLFSSQKNYKINEFGEIIIL